MLNIQPGIHQNLSVLVSLLMQEINECSILLTLFSNIIQVLILWRPLLASSEPAACFKA